MRLTGWSTPHEVAGQANLWLHILTTLGSNEDDTIRTTHTINGCSRSILQYRDALDIIRSHLRESTLYTIYHDQWSTVASEGCTTTDVDSSIIGTRSTRYLGCYDTWNLTGNSLCYVGCWSIQEVIGTYLRDSTYDTLLLLMTVTNDYDLIDFLTFVLENHLDITLIANTDVLSNHTDIGNLQSSVLVLHLNLEVTVEISNNTIGCQCFHNSSTDDRLTRFI